MANLEHVIDSADPATAGDGRDGEGAERGRGLLQGPRVARGRRGQCASLGWNSAV